MPRRMLLAAGALAIIVLVAGCGGGSGPGGVVPPDGDSAANTTEIGPMVVRTASAAGASPAAVSERPDGNRLVVQGRFSAVFDGNGRRVSGPASQVTIGPDGAAGVE